MRTSRVICEKAIGSNGSLSPRRCGPALMLLTPVTARLAHRVGAVAMPRERDLHDAPMPRLGGLAILAGVLLAGLLFLILCVKQVWDQPWAEFFRQ